MVRGGIIWTNIVGDDGDDSNDDNDDDDDDNVGPQRINNDDA